MISLLQIILDLQKICEDNTQSPRTPRTQFPTGLSSHVTVHSHQSPDARIDPVESVAPDAVWTAPEFCFPPLCWPRLLSRAERCL